MKAEVAWPLGKLLVSGRRILNARSVSQGGRARRNRLLTPRFTSTDSAATPAPTRTAVCQSCSGAQTTQGAEHEPQQPVLAEVGGAVEDPVGDGVSPQPVEGAVDAVVEAGDLLAGLVGEAEQGPSWHLLGRYPQRPVVQLRLLGGGWPTRGRGASAGLPPHAGQ